MEFLEPICPRRNPALAAELKTAWRRAARSWWGFFIALFIFLHAGYGLWGWSWGPNLDKWLVETGRYTPYDFQFVLFHFTLYLAPLLLVLADWKRRTQEGRFEELLLTGLNRADVLWSFIAPWFFLIFLPIYALYLTMLPWSDWWLVKFGAELWGDAKDEEGPFGQDSWTRWHCLITLLYFVTTLLFNLLAAVYFSLRVRAGWRRVMYFLLATAGADYLACTICATIYKPQQHLLEGVGDWLAGWGPEFPMFNAHLLIFHAWPWFAAVFYPLKWGLMGWMICAITRRIPCERWGRR
ncbi:MAG: hypothetical protein NTX50_07230 [Candidatus Sumerlaeota bacterium]|nr:hypothetical protein [Candidatus Sumerlaeota bacterium]